MASAPKDCLQSTVQSFVYSRIASMPKTAAGRALGQIAHRHLRFTSLDIDPCSGCDWDVGSVSGPRVIECPDIVSIARIWEDDPDFPAILK